MSKHPHDKRKNGAPGKTSLGRDQASEKSLKDRIAPLGRHESKKSASTHVPCKDISQNPLYKLLHTTRPNQKGTSKSHTKQITHKKAFADVVVPKRPKAMVRDKDSHNGSVGRYVRPKLAIHGSGSKHNDFSFVGASSTSVSFKNLLFGTTQADVIKILEDEVGEIERCVTFPVKGGLSTTAEVKFGSRIAAEKAVKFFHNKLADNRRLDVSIMIETGTVQQVRPPQLIDDYTDEVMTDGHSTRGQTDAHNGQSRDLFSDHNRHGGRYRLAESR